MKGHTIHKGKSLGHFRVPEEPQEDKQLVIAFKRGESGAYEELYARHHARVQGICRRMLRKREDVDEATQETFLRMYRALPRFNGRYQVGAWVARIATNVCLDQIRSSDRHPADLTPGDELEMAAECVDGPEDEVMGRFESHRVRRVIGNLPPMHRAAIVLRDFEGLSYEEVAAALGITDVQVKALIHRARQNFKRNWIESLASIFVPARLLTRFRNVESQSREAAQVATSAGGQVAVSCSTALQQCGAFMADKVAGAATAMLVTGAAVVTATVPATEAPRIERTEPASYRAAETDTVVLSKARRHRPKEAPDANSGEPDPVVEPPVAPTPTPAPEEPVVEPPSEDPGGSEPEPEPSETPPEPEGVSIGLSAATGSKDGLCEECAYPTQITSAGGSASEMELTRFSQSLSGVMQVDGTGSFGVKVDHESHDGRHELFMEARTAEGTYSYVAEGVEVSRGTTAWGGWTYTYSGNYKLTARPNYLESMPEEGAYQVVVEFSHTQQRIVSVQIVFS